MFKVTGTRDSKSFEHSVKPLALIWQHSALQHTGWGPHNTVHVDDLGNRSALLRLTLVM